jgi:glycerol uptake facilitator-like aquaporin
MKINATFQKLIAEFLGVTLFLIAIVGSVTHSFAGQQFPASVAQLSLAITLGLAILITGGISGGHLNPAVSLFFYSRKELSLRDFALYVLAQIGGGLLGAFIGLQLWGLRIAPIEVGQTPNLSVLLGEWVATGGLVFLIGFLVTTKRANLIPVAVALWVFSAASFTQSGAQANPAVTIALLLNGQSVSATGWIIVAELVGLVTGVIGLMVFTAKPTKAKAAKKPVKKAAKK